MFADNPDYVACENLLKQRERLLAEGLGDSQEADALRAAMEAVEPQLSREERTRLNGLSGDLAMLRGAEVFEPTAPAERTPERLGRALRRAWVRREWETLLALLRRGPEFHSPDAIAFFRFAAYDALGHPDTALLFLRHAAQFNPGQARYGEMLLNQLTRLGRLDEAAAHAQTLIADASAPPHVRINAAHVLFRAARRRSEAEARTLHARLVPVLERALAEAQPSVDLPATLIAAAYVVLGSSQEALENSAGARAAYDRALERKPDYAEAWAARGLLRLESDPAGAMADFEQAIDWETESLAPYLHLAPHLLLEGNYERALDLALQILDRTEDSRIRDLALDWIILASSELERPDDTVRETSIALAYAVSGARTRIAEASHQDWERALDTLALPAHRPSPETRVLALLLAK